MRLLIDAQLPPALCGWFGERGITASHVIDELGGQTPDRTIMSARVLGVFEVADGKITAPLIH